MDREILTLDIKIGQNIVFGENENFKIIKEDIIDKRRWSLLYNIVVQRISDGKYFKSTYSIGATETCDEMSYEYDTNAIFIEVFQ